MSTQAPFSQAYSEPNERARQIDAVAWALFFIWVGVGMLAQIPWGWFLVGIAILILGAEFARWQFSGTMEGFWIACGLVFLAGGLWNVLDLPWPLAPILLILFGVAMLAKAFVRS